MEKDFWQILEQRLRRWSDKESQAAYCKRVLNITRQRYAIIKSQNLTPTFEHLLRLMRAGFPRVELIGLCWICFNSVIEEPPRETFSGQLVRPLSRTRVRREISRHPRKAIKKSRPR